MRGQKVYDDGRFFGPYGRPILRIDSQYRERTWVPARDSPRGWWMRPGLYASRSVNFAEDHTPSLSAPGILTAFGRKIPMDFTELIDLAAERLGGAVLFANDDFFAPKENLLKPPLPIFIEGKYTDLGKWMDGWETRRRRTPGFDWCIIRLGLARHHSRRRRRHQLTSRQLSRALFARSMRVDGQPTAEELTDERSWTEILPRVNLNGDSQNPFPINSDERLTHLRFKIYPDGGVARLRVYGEVAPDWDRLAANRRRHRSGGGRKRRDGALMQRHVLRPPAQSDHAGTRGEYERRLGNQAPARARSRLDHHQARHSGPIRAWKLIRPGSKETFPRAARLKLQRRGRAARNVAGSGVRLEAGAAANETAGAYAPFL